MTVSNFTNLFWRCNYFLRFFSYKYLSIISLKKERWHIISEIAANCQVGQTIFKINKKTIGWYAKCIPSQK